METETAALVKAAEQQGIGELLKPLTREIHLFDTFVAGTTRLKDPSVLDDLHVGERLTLRRETNKFDESAICILTQKGDKLGYVPEKDDRIFARLLEAGKVLCALIKDIDRSGGFCRIAIGIYLVDF